MAQELAPREEEIVQLSVDGLTNEEIASQLGVSVGDVNTHWLRIKLKVWGLGRTDAVGKVIMERAERVLRESNVELTELAEMVAEKDRGVLELRAALALLHMAMDQIKSTIWATDNDLTICIIADGEFPTTHFGVKWEVGKTVFEIFKTKDRADPGIAAHLAALAGIESEVRLRGEFANILLRVIPLADEAGASMGCIGILNGVDL